MSALTAHVRRDFERVVDGSGYSSLSGTVEYLGPGQWQAIWPRGTDAADEWEAAVLASTAGEDLSRWGLVVEDAPGRVVLSGPAVTASLALGSSAGRSGDALTVQGLTDTGILAGLLVTVQPGTDVGTTAAVISPDTHYRLTGPAETVLLTAAAAHAGPSAGVTRRRLAALAVPADQGRGSTVELSGRFTTSLLDLARTCDAIGGIGARLEQGAQGVLDLVVTQGTSRPGVLLSVESGSVAGLTLTAAAAEITDAYAGGSGGGTSRLWARRSAAEPSAGFAFRRERFVDARSRRDAVEIEQAAAEEILGRAASDGVAIDAAAGTPWTYLDDYALGDTVRVAAGGIEITDRVRRVVISHSAPGAPVVTPHVGDLSATAQRDAVARLARHVRALGGE